MEKSQLLGSLIAKLKLAYPYYFKDLSKEEVLGLYAMYEEELSNYNVDTLNKAIKEIIRNNKYMPTLKEIIDECEKCKVSRANEVVEKMWEDGYFKKSEYGEITEEQAYRNYNKTLKFIEDGIVPEWLKEDIKKYNVRLINNNDIKYIENKI